MSHNLREWFDTIDKDGNGVIDGRELQTALSNGNLHFSLSSVTQMIRMFSTENRKRLDYAEFKNLHAVLDQIQNSFLGADENRDGLLTYEEVARVLKDAGYTLDGEVFNRLMTTFDLEGNQTIDLTAFIRLKMMLRGARFAFRAFDPRQTGAITLDFNQFLYVASNLV